MGTSLAPPIRMSYYLIPMYKIYNLLSYDHVGFWGFGVYKKLDRYKIWGIELCDSKCARAISSTTLEGNQTIFHNRKNIPELLLLQGPILQSTFVAEIPSWIWSFWFFDFKSKWYFKRIQNGIQQWTRHDQWHAWIIHQSSPMFLNWWHFWERKLYCKWES